jgi:3-oxoacyl-[acyl-carrier-protein] synthase III
MVSSVGILGVALYLPPIVRGNDWWPSEIVAQWKRSILERRPLPPPVLRGPGAARVVAALAEQASDPFQGAVSRHIMPPEMTVLDMAEQAARQAIQRAGVSCDDIDLLLTHTVLPDVLLGNPATQVHHRLGLPRRCFAMETTAAAYSFLMQLTLAEAMIVSGRSRLALLVQACGATRSVDINDPISPLFGDGATAVVLGPVSEASGIRACVHHADGRFPNSLVASVRGGSWSDDGRAVIHVADALQMREVFLETAEVCKESIDAVFESTGLTADDISFFAMYQGTPWIRRAVQDYAGLQHTRVIDTFAETGYMFSAILPAGLARAEQAKLLAPGDLVLATGGGTGISFGSLVMRWGT